MKSSGVIQTGKINMTWTWERNGIVIASVVGLVCFMGIVGIICYATGVWVPYEDAEITELGVCLNNTAYLPVRSLPIDIQQFYWCGTVKGTTHSTGTLYLFYENKVIFQQSVEVKPGHFFLPVATKRFDVYQLGNYRAEIRATQQIVAKTEFAVVAQKSP